MTRDQTIALFQKCEQARADALAAGKSYEAAHEAAKATWNGWAEEMLAKRRVLQEAGEWADNKSCHKKTVGKNEKTVDWIERASIKLSHCRIIRNSNNSTEIKSATPLGDTGEEGADSLSHAVIFSEFIFPGPTDFFGTQFCTAAEFNNAQFHAPVNFFMAQFHGPVAFLKVHFRDDADFRQTHFHDLTAFIGSQFHGPVDFRSAIFSGPTFFRDLALQSVDKSADANFTGIQVERIFDMSGTSFCFVPNFSQAGFAEAPDLDNVSYPISGFWQRGNSDDIAKYRHLRRIALGGHNHDAEATAFKGEIRAKRFTEHRGQPLLLIAGMIYDAVSDFGRSILRPLLVWLLSMPVFMVIYLINAGKLSVFDHACNGSAYWLSALVFSVKSALLVVPWDDQQIRSTYACLYGVNFSAGEAVPPVSAFIQAGQTVLSAIVVFLLLLGIRNQFKIK